MVRPHGQEESGFEPVQTRGEGVNFSRFCADFHYGRPALRRTRFKHSLKGALNPNFLNLTINREKFWL